MRFNIIVTICYLFASSLCLADPVDTIAIKGGYSYTNSYSNNINGGIEGVPEAEENGLGLSASIVFNASLNGYFKPYLDITWLSQEDRDFVIPGAGIKHDFYVEDSNFEPFYSLGVGYNFTEWSEDPVDDFQKNSSSGEAVVFTAQTGFDYYFTDHLAVDLTFRYDAYAVDTTIVDNNSVTTIEDRGSASLLAGLVYRFGDRQSSKRDDDRDGIYNRYDRCPGTLKNVPVNEAGCPQYHFNVVLNFEFSKYELSSLTNHPSFNTIAFLNKNQNYNVRIVGYTDNAGSNQFNQRLSEERANEERKFLMVGGIDSSRIEIIGRGESESVKDNSSESNRTENRRINIEFYRQGQ